MLPRSCSSSFTLYIIAKFYLEEILSSKKRKTKIMRKRASQERLGHGTRRKSKTLSRTTPPTGVSEESSARARTWTDCHNAVLCLESAMTLVTASCPFQRARPLQRDHGQESSPHHPTFLFRRVRGGVPGGLVDLAKGWYHSVLYVVYLQTVRY